MSNRLFVVLVMTTLSGSANAQGIMDLWQPREGKPAESKGSVAVKRAFDEAIARSAVSTVQILCDGRPASMGTIVDADGYVVTKASEMVGAVTVKLRGGKQVPGNVIGAVSAADIALIKIEATGLTPVTWGDANLLKVGQFVATPGMNKDPIAVGVISVGRRKMPDKIGFLGVMLDDAEGGAGAKIVRVEMRTAAEKAGFLAEDIVTVAAGIHVGARDDLVGVLRDATPGEEMKFTVMRDGKPVELKAKLGSQPATPIGARRNPQERFGGDLSGRSVGFPAIYQHDTVLSPRECGGPLVTLDGTVVGINIARAGRTESYLLPADVIEPLVEQMKSGKYQATPKTIQITEKPGSPNEAGTAATSVEGPTTNPSTAPSTTRPVEP